MIGFRYFPRVVFIKRLKCWSGNLEFAAGFKKHCEMQENEVQSFKNERDGVGKALPPPPHEEEKMTFFGGRVRRYVG